MGKILKYITVFVIVFLIIVVVVPTYLANNESDYASEARITISNIHNASKMYYVKNGEWPFDVDELEKEGQIDISELTKSIWTFELLQQSQYGITINAISSEKMAEGSDKRITYYTELGMFYGYGSHTTEDDIKLAYEKYSSNTSPGISSNDKAKTNDGVYSMVYTDVIMTVTISGNSWKGKTTYKLSGDTEYERGLVKGSDLYDATGHAYLGYIAGNDLIFKKQNRRNITLSKIK